MTDIAPLHRRLVDRILDGDGRASGAERRAAFDNGDVAPALRRLIDKVVWYAHKATDDDIATVRNAGYSEDQILELVICAAVGQATRQYRAALTALDAASEQPGGSDAPGDSR